MKIRNFKDKLMSVYIQDLSYISCLLFYTTKHKSEPIEAEI